MKVKVWADVAGYSFYYFGNNGYWNFIVAGHDSPNDAQPHEQ
jgi:hypothetical protein